MERITELLGKSVVYQALDRRLTGRVRIPTQDHEFIVVTPDGSTMSDVIHVSDVISIIA